MELPTGKIFVTSVYYKHGEYDSSFYDFGQLRGWMSETYSNHTEAVEMMTDKDLLRNAILWGKENIDEQWGWGIISIVYDGKVYF